MKKLLLTGAAVFALVLVLLALISTLRVREMLDVSFAEEVALRYSDFDKQVDLIITDPEDVQLLKDNFCNWASAAVSTPSCGFAMDVSLTFRGGNRAVVMCPACDTCDVARVGETEVYVRIIDRPAVDAVLAKYGAVFPCV